SFFNSSQAALCGVRDYVTARRQHLVSSCQGI
ncbi:MAG: hypothetical protein ACI89J_001320, partial [Hyphomicrobiaceae bacterium]